MRVRVALRGFVLGVALVLGTANAGTVPAFFAPAAADAFKRSPVFELTRHNGHALLASRRCTLVLKGVLVPPLV